MSRRSREGWLGGLLTGVSYLGKLTAASSQISYKFALLSRHTPPRYIMSKGGAKKLLSLSTSIRDFGSAPHSPSLASAVPLRHTMAGEDYEVRRAQFHISKAEREAPADGASVVRIEVLTPRSVPPRADLEAADEEDEIEEQIPEFRNTNKTDAEVWQEMLAKYPSLAAIEAWRQSWFNTATTCLPANNPQLENNRRDYSILLDTH